MEGDLQNLAFYKGFPAGSEGWEGNIYDIVKGFSGVVNYFAFMGEVNIMHMHPGRNSAFNKVAAKYPELKRPIEGASLFPPQKTLDYFKVASEAARRANPEVVVIGLFFILFEL